MENSHSIAEQFPVADQKEPTALSLAQRRAFMQLPLEKRRQLLASQAEALLAHYQQYSAWQELQTGNIVDY